MSPTAPSPIATANIRAATPNDVDTIFALIHALAVYEKLADMVTSTPAMLRENLFGACPSCECVLLSDEGVDVGFALYFTTYSTFLGKPGLYLEDLFVVPAARGKGYGKALLVHLAALAKARGCGRFEWRVLDWNRPSIDFYKSLGASIHPEWYLARMTAPEFAALAATGTSTVSSRETAND
jgi:GNAT superfamily N-acetyltransferase